MYHSKIKHINAKLHFIRDEIDSGAIQVVKIDSKDNPTDILTKLLSKNKFENCLNMMIFSHI